MVGRVTGRVDQALFYILKEVGSSCGMRESPRRDGLGWVLSPHLTSGWVVERCKERNYHQRVPAEGTLFSPLNGRRNDLPFNKDASVGLPLSAPGSNSTMCLS